MNLILTSFWNTWKWIALAGVLALLAVSALAEPVEGPPSSWNGPVFGDGHWELTGIVEQGVQRRTVFEEQLDLVEVRYGRGTLWALVGIQPGDGAYESLVPGIANRDMLQEAFQQPRYITLRIPGTRQAVTHSACQNPLSEQESARCRITRLVEGGRLPVLLDTFEEPTGDLSNVFIHTGLFVPHYRYGFLTWDVLPGQIIEQGLEGG